MDPNVPMTFSLTASPPLNPPLQIVTPTTTPTPSQMMMMLMSPTPMPMPMPIPIPIPAAAAEASPTMPPAYESTYSNTQPCTSRQAMLMQQHCGDFSMLSMDDDYYGGTSTTRKTSKTKLAEDSGDADSPTADSSVIAYIPKKQRVCVRKTSSSNRLKEAAEAAARTAHELQLIQEIIVAQAQPFRSKPSIHLPWGCISFYRNRELIHAHDLWSDTWTGVNEELLELRESLVDWRFIIGEGFVLKNENGRIDMQNLNPMLTYKVIHNKKQILVTEMEQVYTVFDANEFQASLTTRSVMDARSAYEFTNNCFLVIGVFGNFMNVFGPMFSLENVDLQLIANFPYWFVLKINPAFTALSNHVSALLPAPPLPPSLLPLVQAPPQSTPQPQSQPQSQTQSQPQSQPQSQSQSESQSPSQSQSQSQSQPQPQPASK